MLLVCFLPLQVHTRLRVPRASGVPHALCWARDFMQSLGRALRREVAGVFGIVMSTLVMPGQKRQRVARMRAR